MSHQLTASRTFSLSSYSDSFTVPQLVSWLAVELNRQPEPVDLYSAGKYLYQSGFFIGSANLLRLYCAGPGAESPGHHLLAYSLHMLNQRAEAIACLKQAVNAGFEADWQLLVELKVQEMKENMQAQAAASEEDTLETETV